MPTPQWMPEVGKINGILLLSASRGTQFKIDVRSRALQRGGASCGPGAQKARCFRGFHLRQLLGGESLTLPGMVESKLSDTSQEKWQCPM